MCGHGVIALVTVALETGMLPKRNIIRIDSPAGLITAYPRQTDSNEKCRVQSVAFENVPSFVYKSDQVIQVPGLGQVRYDIAFGGAFYAFVEAADVGVALEPRDFRRLIEYGTLIKRAIVDTQKIQHPFDADLSFLYGTMFIGPSLLAGANSRQVCIFSDGQVDRSPCGTGVSARLALEIARGRLKLNETYTVESILGTQFTGHVIADRKYSDYAAVIPQVEGRAWITGRSEFLVAPDDPLKTGFLLR